MADQQYMSGRQKYQRPQALLFSENPGQLVNGSYVPEGYEINSGIIGIDTPNSFLILSDHSRGPITVKPTRIEQRQRTVNGHMRSYHVADKLTISTSWNLLPSRSFALDPLFDENGTTNVLDYTVDGGAEEEMLSFKNFGKKSLTEIKELLAGMGLTLGMQVDSKKLKKA